MLKIKNNKFIGKQVKKLKSKRGAELVENILVMGITVAMIILILYPQITNISSQILDSISSWALSLISNISGI